MYDQSNPTVCPASLESPMSLENYCLDFICDHIEEICVLAAPDLNSTLPEQVRLFTVETSL
jgi:hypothetical protein